MYFLDGPRPRGTVSRMPVQQNAGAEAEIARREGRATVSRKITLVVTDLVGGLFISATILEPS
jgi:hypothetical protein